MLSSLSYLTTFLTIVETGSFHRAAKRLGVSQPAVSRHIKALEDELGAELFHRTAKGTELNRFGASFASRARQMQHAWRFAAADLGGDTERKVVNLRIGAGPAWSYSIVPDAILHLRQEFPRVRVDIVTRIDGFYDTLSNGMLDVLVAELPDPGRRAAGIVYEPLVQLERLIFAQRGHPLHGGGKVEAHDLARYPWLLFRETVFLRQAIEAYFQQHGLRPPAISVATTSIQSALRLMLGNDYLMLLPNTFMCEGPELRIRPLPLAHPVGRYWAGLIHRPSMRRVAAFASFRDLLVGEIHMRTGDFALRVS